MDMSAYVLGRMLPPVATKFHACLALCDGRVPRSFALAELNTLLSSLSAGELSDACAEPPLVSLSPFVANYVAAMVEYACAHRAIAPPAWTTTITPLVEPAFGTTLQALRLHLLTRSPPPFRRRNIFIDSSLGGQV